MPAISRSNALRAIQEEYLSGFLRAGGSSFKVILGSDGLLEGFLEELSEASQHSQSTIVRLAPRVGDDGKSEPATQIHRMDALVKAILEGVDVPRCLNSVAYMMLSQEGYEPTSFTSERDLDPIDLQLVAKDHDATLDDVVSQVRRALNRMRRSTTYLVAPFAAFLTALLEFRLGLNTPDYVHDGPVVANWSRDVYNCLSPVRVLKKYRIYERIRETNARQILQSALQWRHACIQDDSGLELGGLVVVLDIRAYEFDLAEYRRARKHESATAEIPEYRDAPPLRFSKITFLKLLTVLRHLLDDIGRLPGVLVLVLGSTDLIDRSSARNLRLYDALAERVLDNVVDVTLPNPSSALLVLEANP